MDVKLSVLLIIQENHSVPTRQTIKANKYTRQSVVNIIGNGFSF